MSKKGRPGVGDYAKHGFLAGIFFGLVLICGVFFGFGYSLGRGNGAGSASKLDPAVAPAISEAAPDDTTTAANATVAGSAPPLEQQDSIASSRNGRSADRARFRDPKLDSRCTLTHADSTTRRRAGDRQRRVRQRCEPQRRASLYRRPRPQVRDGYRFQADRWCRWPR